MSKLNELTTQGNFKNKVAGILSALEGYKEKPRIFEALRPMSQQLEKVRNGYSQSMISLHLAGPDGKARAADIADSKRGWNASKRFWLILGAAAQSYGVGWGGLFGLTKQQKETVQRVIIELRKQGFPLSSELYQVQIGWDPAHVQLKNNWPGPRARKE